MTEYVVGFNFTNGGRDLVLIQKRRPDWQAGLLNGVGGHVEPGECALSAMVREYAEETGDKVKPNWKLFCIYHVGCATINFFQAFTVDTTARTVTDETVFFCDVRRLNQYKTIPNLRWLIPMAQQPGLWVELTERTND